MKSISMEKMLEAGLHFGHQAQRWNPKMEPFIFGQRAGVHIINLEKTAEKLKKATDFIKKISSEDKIILFIGTKKQAQQIIASEATRCKMPYVSERWLGGMLTNFTTICRNIKKLKELEKIKNSNQIQRFTKKEKINFQKNLGKLEDTLQGVKEINRLPDVLFVVDVVKENTAIGEACKLGIPIVAICDTNADPSGIDYIIPANDDAIKSIRFLVSHVADAVLEGKKKVKKSKTISKKTVGKEKIVKEKIVAGK